MPKVPNKPQDSDMPWKDQLKQYLEQMHTQYMQNTDAKGIGTLQGLKNVMMNSPVVPQVDPNTQMVGGAVKTKFADGGDVQIPSDMDAADTTAYMLRSGQEPPAQGLDTPNPWLQGAAEKMMAPTPPQPWMQAPQMAQAPATPPPTQAGAGAPDIKSILSKAQSSPTTDYSFYKGMTSEDRMNLYKQLMAQKNSGGNLAMSGLAGLGDAISRSYGKQNSNYQTTVRDAQQNSVTQNLGAFDKQREQKLQDYQGNLEMQMNDPKSPIAQSMRKTFQAAGLNVPENVPPALLLKVSSDLGSFALKKATLEQTGEYRKSEEAIKQNQQKLGAAEALSKMGITGRVSDMAFNGGAASDALQHQMVGTSPSAPSSSLSTPDNAYTTPEAHQTAIQWAQANPHDPRAAQMMQIIQRKQGA